MHPTDLFGGEIGLRAGPDTPMLAFKSVLETAAFAGYPFVFLQSTTEPARVLEVEAQVPWRPGEGEDVRVLNLRAGETEFSFVWKAGPTVFSELKMPAPDAMLAGVVCKEWSSQGRHRDPTDEQRDPLIIYADDRLPTRVIFTMLEEAARCTRP